jgi:WD40-like Beta Propeller Repeat
MTTHSVLRHIVAPLAVASCALAVPAIAAEAASADSVVYAKQGNLFLTSPDGAKSYQLTFDGGYSSPSQAANGTIGALRYGQLVRLNRSGQLLNAPINAMGSPGRASSAGIGGPYEPRISPDGTRFAYYFYVQTSFDDLENNIRWIDTGSYSTWTYADHFTSPVSESEYDRSVAQPEWLTNDRLMAATGPYINMVTWKLGTGHGYTYQASQWWFTLVNPPDEWGVSAPHYYADPALSADGSRLAMTDGGGDQSDMVLASTNGPAWVGEPPYPEVDYVNMQSDVPAPTPRCQTNTGAYSNPTWSRDSSMVAYASGDGVHVMTVPADFDCSKLSDRLIVPGGSDPAFGPADVDMAQRPTPPSPPRPGPGAQHVGAVALRGLSISPRSFRAVPRRPAIASSSGAVVRFTMNRAARVTLTVSSGKRVRGRRIVAGGAGINLVPFTGWLGGHRLAAGRYRLTASAGTSAGRVSFQVKR